MSAVAELVVEQADITKLEVDAIANAANSHLLHGGGVAAAIARAAGPELDRESRERAPVPVGEAGATSAGALRRAGVRGRGRAGGRARRGGRRLAARRRKRPLVHGRRVHRLRDAVA